MACIVLCAGVFVQLCVPGVLGLCTAIQPVSAPGLQCLHCVDVCHHCMQNVVPAEVYKPTFVLQELLYGEYKENMLFELSCKHHMPNIFVTILSN